MQERTGMGSRILIVYFTRTGTTKQLAETIATSTRGDLEAITERRKRSGLFGYLRSGYEAARRRLVPIDPATHAPSTYDLVVIGTPIWNLSVSSPVRSYLHHHRGRFRKVAFFCTCGGRGGDQAFAQMAEVCGVTPVATLVVREHEIARAGGEVARFVAELESALATSATLAAAPGPQPDQPAPR